MKVEQNSMPRFGNALHQMAWELKAQESKYEQLLARFQDSLGGPRDIK